MPRAVRSNSMAEWWSGCTPIWRSARSRLPTPSRRWARNNRRSGRQSTKPLRRPRIEAARDRHIIAAVFRRNVEADDFGVGDQVRKIRRLEKQFRFGVHRVERLLRQRALDLTTAAGERGERRRAVDRDTNVGQPL